MHCFLDIPPFPDILDPLYIQFTCLIICIHYWEFLLEFCETRNIKVRFKKIQLLFRNFKQKSFNFQLKIAINIQIFGSENSETCKQNKFNVLGN